MRQQPNLEEQVARRPPADSGLPLRGDPDLLAGNDARRDPDVELERGGARVAALVHSDALQRQAPLRAAIRFLERDLDLPRGIEAAAAKRPAAPASQPAEELLEEIAMHAGIAFGAVVELPIGRRSELFAGLAGAERIVGRPLLGVAQHFVRFADFLEARLRV